jgi:hypothetical protein
MNVEIGTEAAQFPEKKTHKWDIRCVCVCYLAPSEQDKEMWSFLIFVFWPLNSTQGSSDLSLPLHLDILHTFFDPSSLYYVLLTF